MYTDEKDISNMKYESDVIKTAFRSRFSETSLFMTIIHNAGAYPIDLKKKKRKKEREKEERKKRIQMLYTAFPN